jgi:16S rRNA (guanine527-N7)-methyltransferase
LTAKEFQEHLVRRARLAGVTLSPELGARLEVYYRLLATWNQRINLSGLDLSEPTPEAMDRLLVEPLVAAAHVSASAVKTIDIGSGGGSPAVPLALAVPRLELLLVESKVRKSVFLREVIRALGMRADVATARFEDLLAQSELRDAYDLLTIRAVKVEGPVLNDLQTFLKVGGRLFWFRTSGAEPRNLSTPRLTQTSIHPLVEPLRSQLVVLEKVRGARDG